jgi:UDP-3-O-[3-hydroxymyristoyl] N-acetylglucosamine deacetylase
MEAIDKTSSLEPHVLVVDDEPSIGRALQQVLEDEGIFTAIVTTGEEALKYIEKQQPSLVLLDIWLPGTDGLEVLKHIKESYPSVVVVMMSGHAMISTAVQATRLGALDFIEKPLDLSSTIALVRRALCIEDSENEDEETTETRKVDPVLASNHDLVHGLSEAIQHVKPYVEFVYGQGLHSGKKSGLVLEPLPPNSGIHFTGVINNIAVPAHIDFIHSTGFATTLKRGETQISTIEHLMSALHAYGITNLLVKCNEEVPVMDGSSREFCSLIEQTVVEDQPAEYSPLVPARKVKVGDGEEWISIEPAETFSIHYTLIYPEPVGRQEFFFELGDPEVYKREIAPARTFGFVKDIGALQRKGLALGGRFDNFVLIGDDGPINDTLRFKDEFVRHKILDAIGDLYLLGLPPLGKVEAVMTGHSDNVELLRKLRVSLEQVSS